MEGTSPKLIRVFVELGVPEIWDTPFTIPIVVGEDYSQKLNPLFAINNAVCQVFLEETAKPLQPGYMRVTVMYQMLTCYLDGQPSKDAQVATFSGMPFTFNVPIGTDVNTIEDALSELRPVLQKITSYVVPADDDGEEDE